MSVRGRDGREWLERWQAMSDEELLDERFGLYDFAEGLETECGAYAWVRTALGVIGTLEDHRVVRRAVRRAFRDAARAGLPDLDADVFVDALVELNQFRRELGRELDVITAGETFRGAIEVAERRKHAANAPEGG